MKLLHKIGIALWLILLIPACSSEQEPPATDSQQQIRFNFFLQEGDQVIPLSKALGRGARGAQVNDLSTGFELYGVWNTKDMPTSFVRGGNTATEAGKRFFDEQQVMWNASTGSYEYTGERRYWVGDGKTRHSFAARSIDPKRTVDGLAGGGNTSGAFLTTRWIPTIDYYVHPDPKEQHDLLVAFGPMNVVVHNSTPTVNLYFKHALSKVRFKILTSAGSTLYGVNLSVTYVGGLRYNSEQTFTAEVESSWIPTVTGKTYPLATNLLVPASASDESSAFLAGELLVQPQKPTINWLELSITYRLADGGTAKSAKLGIPPGVDMKPGMQYTYYIRVADQPEVLTITDLQLEPWKTEYKEVDAL